jgi:hypothetical protein
MPSMIVASLPCILLCTRVPKISAILHQTRFVVGGSDDAGTTEGGDLGSTVADSSEPLLRVLAERRRRRRNGIVLLQAKARVASHARPDLR